MSSMPVPWWVFNILRIFNCTSIFLEECFSNPKTALLCTPVLSWHHHSGQDSLVQVQNRKVILGPTFTRGGGPRDGRNGQSSTRKPWCQERRPWVGQPCPGGHEAQHGQLVKGEDCPALLCTEVAPSCVHFWALQLRKILSSYRACKGG